MLLRLSLSILLIAVALMRAAPAVAGPALVFDPDTDAVLYAEDADAYWYPASLTKLMTAYLTFQALRDGDLTMDSKLVCSPAAHAQPPSKIGLPVGGEMSVEMALKALIVKSANDVAVMLAEAIAGSEEAFVARMNQTALRLGMMRTKFFNANGLPHDGQVSTARDLAFLARAIIREFPEHADLFTLQSMRIGKITLRTHNRLLQDFEGADGMKTGFICASGYNVVASATRDGRRLVAVVLGGTSGRDRNERAAELLDHGFHRYDWKLALGDKLPALAFQASLDEAPDLRPQICAPRRSAPRRTKARKAASASVGGSRLDLALPTPR